MNWPPDSKNWFEYPAECLWYLMPGLAVHLAALLVSLLVIAAFRAFKCSKPRLSTALFFQGYLLLGAMIVNGFWSCSVWGNLYWSVDYTADFSVFYPITPGLIDYSWGPEMSGGLNGITLMELNMIWAILASSAWLFAFVATRWTTRFRMKSKGEQVMINKLPAQSRKFCGSS